MSGARAWPALLLGGCCVCGSCALAPTAVASPGATPTADAANPSLPRVEVAMVGDVAQDPLLFERIRSLFPIETAVVPSEVEQLDQRAVLAPRRPDTVYIWIRATSERSARVYLTLAEPGAQARYLFREVGLDSGLDEVGSETLAEVAHSSARALWLHEQQSSREALVDALKRETRTRPEPPPAAAPLPTVAMAASPTVRDSAERLPPRAPRRRETAVLRLGLGASGTTHNSGREGWLQEVGGFLAIEYRGRLSLRAAARYLVPASFGVPPARVQLSGATGELRGGWLSTNAVRIRVRLEAGLGALLGTARGTIVDDQPKAQARAAQDFYRGYALAAAGVEWPIGPVWLATGLDLRVPLGTTSYEVEGQAGASTSASLCPGASLEVGFGFEPALR